MISDVMRIINVNAIKYSHKNSMIEHKCRLEGDFVYYSITDNGLGIESADIDKLFKIDVHHTTLGTENEQGSGLGLILAKEFVEKNGGSIYIESQPNSFTTVTFTLPTYKETLN